MRGTRSYLAVGAMMTGLVGLAIWMMLYFPSNQKR